jgi:hypothetical protein
MSKIEVDQVDPQSGTTLTLGTSGDTVSIPSGVTLANNGTATGFFEGISWQSVVTASTLTTVAGKGYPINTTSNACTVTLPSSASVGDQIQIVDYAGTFATNNITLTSSLNIEGGTSDKVLTTNREGVTITYVDVTQGWVATSGVNSGSQALDPITYSADMLIVAGGAGGGGGASSGGGGAGGFRTSTQTFNGGTVYTITVGDGSAGDTGAGSTSSNGSNSSISGSGLTTITSAGGGGAGGVEVNGANGGSGGGAGGTSGPSTVGGSGNTPSTSPSQGNDGGTSTNTASPYPSSGGGGAGSSGANGTGSSCGAGGNGTASSITGSSVTYAGGGGGGNSYGASAGSGGTGGGGNGATSGNGSNGTTNLGGGGGGGPSNGGSGGKGVVIISIPDANYSGTTTGSPTVATGVSGKTILTFTGSGSYTA